MVYQKYNDYELVYMVQEKDDFSYDVLFKKYLPIIKRIAFDYYKNFNHYGYDLDDFLQEGYLYFHKAAVSYDENKDSLFYTFVVLCLHRGFISFCRKMTSESKNINSDYLIDCDSVPLAASSRVEDGYIFKEFINDIWKIVYEFPIEYACVFELRYNQFKYNEIGTLLDIPTRKAQFIYRVVINKVRSKLILY